ncbi:MULTISPECIES: YggT family protein [Nitratidesulfovibrio]|uniref:YggT family protein n=2 Tax=Nitratidesulfovibrio TaxID=2802295 RepID=B8DNQ3_NITV9|nr:MULTISPECIES: YggT family protein [Nitratidesulfovibrio]MBZ2171540.1 YggT family protein [Nitratidesulfovibrio sp. SRB-5]NHZ47546.1 YggT family protein [Nitratidesulfovibrio liaohensis]RXF76383.1 YggT family protein [Desulfovibrio sp. DS-1]WMW65675.1 YggT family protein [Nitratidesulfovibrio liaohensis]
MFVFSNLIFGVARVLDAVLNLYFWIVIVSAVLSWVNPDPYNPIVRILRNLTEPVFYRVRKWIPFTYLGGLDLSPVVVLLAIQFINAVLVQSLYQFAVTMR